MEVLLVWTPGRQCPAPLETEASPCSRLASVSPSAACGMGVPDICVSHTCHVAY